MNLKAGVLKNSKAQGIILPDAILLIRLAVSVALLILAYKINVSSLVSLLMLIFSVVIAGFDILISAVKAVVGGDYFNENCLTSVAAIAAFDAGCFTESIVFVVVYQLCASLLKTLLKYSGQNAVSYLPPENNELYAKMHDELSASDENNSASLKRYTYLAVRILCAVAVLFAAVMPLVSKMTYLMSVRRGAMLLIAAVPVSMLSSLSLPALYGFCISSAYGVNVKSVDVLKNARSLKTVVFDKTDVITGGTPKITSIISPILDKEDFLRMAAFVAFKSEQKISEPIVSAYNGEIVPDYINDFSDIPGKGMEISIGGRQVVLGTKELFDTRGIAIDEEYLRGGYVWYLAIAGRFAGAIIFNENINPYAERTIADLREMNVDSVIVSEESDEICKKTASQLGVKTVYPYCDTMKKLNVLKELKNITGADSTLMYVSAENIGYHSNADIDIRVGESGENEDIFMSNIGIFGLPVLINSSRMIDSISSQNLKLSVVIKAILMILALTGWSTLWFIVLLDYVACMLGVLNILRIPSNVNIEK